MSSGLIGPPSAHYKMSSALLVSGPAGKPPRLIPRDKIESLRANADISAIRSEEPAFLDHFTLDTIRISTGKASDPLSGEDLTVKLVKKAVLAPSMRAPALLFLSLIYNYGLSGRIIIVTRQPAGFASPIAADIQRFFPAAKVVLHCGDAVDLLYSICTTTVDHSPQGERTYLLSLGTTLTHHRDLVTHFRPFHALMGIDTRVTKNYLFYPGELWIPPFGGSDTKVAYLRTDFTEELYRYDPMLKGQLWDASLIRAAIDPDRNITNERTVSTDPKGTDSYLFGKYPNDYSHMFCYAALGAFLGRYGDTNVPDDKLLEIYGIIVNAP
jgi:hypothetical protein